MAKKASDGESIAGYFKRIFQENPKLLKNRSNEEVLKRWLADHPGQKEVPAAVKNGLSNTKSVVRSKRRRRRKAAAQEAPAAAAIPRAKTHDLEALEAQIDDVLIVARKLNHGLEEVIDLLRRARNKVVWQLG